MKCIVSLLVMKLSIIIPCYNEENTIAEVISRISEHYKKEKEVIIVDDASNDKTNEILNDLKLKYPFIKKIICHSTNKGKGAAINSAIKELSGDLTIIQDADLEYNPIDYNNLIQPFEHNLADVVYGSRFTGGKTTRVLFFWHKLGNNFLTFFSNIFTDLNLTDMETGYKIFKTDILKKITLTEKRFGIEPEITAKIAKLRVNIYEVGISYQGRSYTEGKKITWKDGLSAIRCIIKYNLFK